MWRNTGHLTLVIALLSPVAAAALRQSGPTARATGKAAGAMVQSSKKGTARNQEGATPDASTTAARLRHNLGPVPSVARGQDGLLNLFGQRATQSQLVTSTNVKDPVTDTFVFTQSLPVESAEPVNIPGEQFTVSLAKFYATVPTLDSISRTSWHLSAGSPLFSLRHIDGIRGIRSAAPSLTFGGPVTSRLSLLEAFSYRLSRTTIQNLDGEADDTRFQSYDWNSHADIDAGAGQNVTARFSLFSQAVASATLAALVTAEASPDFTMGGGSLYVSDTFSSNRGAVLDSIVTFRHLHVRVLPHGAGPMFFIEQGELEGNYFDTLRRATSRFEWKESVRLPQFRGWGQHQTSFGLGYARSGFESTHISNTIILRGEEEDELTAVFNFAGSPFESLTMDEATLWLQDRWDPSSRVSITLGQRFDRTSVSGTNEWAPRVGFAVRPFDNGRTVIRGGIGRFFDVMPLNAGTFVRGRRRVTQFFDDGTPISDLRTLSNIVSRPALRTAHVLGWNLELDHQLTRHVVVRLRGEERRGRDLLLVTPDRPGSQVTALILRDDGHSVYRELEATATYKTSSWGSMNFSYIRSSSFADTNTFGNTFGTFEKLVISANRYARSRIDTPNRFVSWAEIRLPGDALVRPAIDVHTGFPFAFVDADANVSPIPDFGRLPRFASLDLGLQRDFSFQAFDYAGKLRVGFTVYNLTNHFNPREAHLGETEDQKQPEFRGFLNGSNRSYRATAVLNF